MSNNRWGIIALVMGFAALGHFNRVGISVAGDELFIPKLDISEYRMGWVYTAFLIVYTCGMLPCGWLIDRIGTAKALTLFGVTMGTFVALTGVLGWIYTAPFSLWIGLLVIRGLAGVCNSPLHPGAAHVVSDLMPSTQRATANGMITAGALIGIACCYPVLGWLMDALTWQWAFVVGGSMLILYGIVWRMLASSSLPHPKPMDNESDDDEDLVFDSSGIWHFMTQSSLWLITLSYAAYGYFQYLFFYWMGYYFKEVLHVPKEDARWASFWIMIAMGFGMAFGGRFADVVCRKLGTADGRRVIIFAGMGLGAVFGVIGVNVDRFLVITVCLAASMGATGMVEGVFWTTATDIGGQSRGLSGAFMNTGGNLGGLIAPVLTPVMAERIGWKNSIIVACVISGVGALLWFLINPPEQSDKTNSEGAMNDAETGSGT